MANQHTVTLSVGADGSLSDRQGHVQDALYVETCAKQGDRFIPLNGLDRLTLKDPNYVDGSIRVLVNGKPLITDREWTDIVHWWALMNTILRDLSTETRPVIETYFPDCALKMRFEAVGERLAWEIGGPEPRKATLDRFQTIQVLAQESQATFERLKVLNPACAINYDVDLAYLAKLKLPSPEHA